MIINEEFVKHFNFEANIIGDEGGLIEEITLILPDYYYIRPGNYNLFEPGFCNDNYDLISYRRDTNYAIAKFIRIINQVNIKFNNFEKISEKELKEGIAYYEE